jgi:predicted flap endonuclease-1-like 5' DNA nuclease
MVMIELLREYLPAILVAVVIGLIVGFLIFRPRQSVRLTDSAPLRPHMTSSKDSSRRDRRSEAGDLASEAAAAASDVTGELIGAPVHRHLSGGAESADDLVRLKGIGPKLAEILRARGFTRFEQLAHLTPAEVDLLDQQIGPFGGRIRRDRIVEQAAYLARGDVDGFEQHFGKL